MVPKSPYEYRITPNTLGIGVENFALVQPGLAISQDFYSARYDVKGSLRTRDPGYIKLYQDMPDSSLRQGGVYLSGDLALQALVDFNQAASK